MSEFPKQFPKQNKNMATAQNTSAQDNSADNIDNSAVDQPIEQLSALAEQALGYIATKANVTIANPGKYSARVTSATDYTRDGTPVKILNFAAITQYQLDRAYDLFDAGDFVGAGNQGLTTNVRMNGKDYVPSVGEYVFVQIGERPVAAKVDQNTGEMTPATTGLFVVSVMPQPAAEPVIVDVRAQLAARRAKLAGQPA